MSKRRSQTGQMRREDYEAQEDDDGEEQGSFRQADKATISKRRIVSVRGRKKPSAAAGGGGGGGSGSGSGSGGVALGGGTGGNPFASFSGLTGKGTGSSSSNGGSAKANPFSSFTGLAKTPAPAASSSSSSSSSAASGRGAATSAMMMTPLGASSSLRSSAGNGSAAATPMAKLNRALHAWAKSEVSKNPTANLTEGFADYLKYAQSIEEQDSSSSSSSSSSSLSLGGAASRSAAPAAAASAASKAAPAAKPAAAPSSSSSSSAAGAGEDGVVCEYTCKLYRFKKDADGKGAWGDLGKMDLQLKRDGGRASLLCRAQDELRKVKRERERESEREKRLERDTRREARSEGCACCSSMRSRLLSYTFTVDDAVALTRSGWPAAPRVCLLFVQGPTTNTPGQVVPWLTPPQP